MDKIEFDPTLVHEWLRCSARRFPDKEALICGNQRLTYKDLDRRSDHLAAALRDIGIHRHDRAAILLDNSFETVISLYGILKAGGVFTDDMIDAYIDLKMDEVTRLRMTTHPVEFDMYYSM